MSFMFSYLVAFWNRVKLEHQAGNISKKGLRWYSIFTIYQILSFAFVSTIFAVSPDDSIIMHTVPFINLVIALSILAPSNLWYILQTTSISKILKFFGFLYVFLHINISAIYVIMLVNGTFDDLYYKTLDYITFHIVINRLWLVFSLLIPLFISLVFSSIKKNLMVTVKIIDPNKAQQ